MSAEGKKKRGEAGAKNARMSPFRLNGLSIDWELRKRGVLTVAADHIGAHMVRGAIGGLVYAQATGFGFQPSARLVRLIDESLEQCPVGAAVFDTIETVPAAIAAE